MQIVYDQQKLKDCVEKESVDTHCDYEAHKESVDEVRFLYNWWLNRVKEEKSFGDEAVYNVDDEMLTRLIKVRGFLWT
jgi:hypothetical protein